MTTPYIEVKKYIVGHKRIFVQFKNTSYVSFYQYRDFENEPLMECAYSLTMEVNNNSQFIRNTDDVRRVEMYSLCSKDPSFSVKTNHANSTFVGDGSEFFVNYGFGLTIYKREY